MKLLDTIAGIAAGAIERKGIGPICGHIIWLYNDDIDEEVPALCLIPRGVEHSH